jgi:hypothetical protein
LHTRSVWQALLASPHFVPSGALVIAPHAPAMHRPGSLHGSVVGMHSVPSGPQVFTSTGASRTSAPPGASAGASLTAASGVVAKLTHCDASGALALSDQRNPVGQVSSMRPQNYPAPGALPVGKQTSRASHSADEAQGWMSPPQPPIRPHASKTKAHLIYFVVSV